MFPLNLPNVLTLIRILLVPVLVVFLLGETPNGDFLAAAVFAIASFTDVLDGYLARSRESITAFGKLVDPIADKLLVIGALVSLVSLNRLAAWVAMVIIARELAVTMTRMHASHDGVVVAAAPLGKAKTVSQVIAIFLLIAIDPAPVWLSVFVYLAVALTIASGIDYFFGLRKHLEQAKLQRASSQLRKERCDEETGSSDSISARS